MCAYANRNLYICIVIQTLSLWSTKLKLRFTISRHGREETVVYNFFSNKIDKLTYALDEIGFTIAATYDSNHNEA